MNLEFSSANYHLQLSFANYQLTIQLPASREAFVYIVILNVQHLQCT
jgi:hypothetical protein